MANKALVNLPVQSWEIGGISFYPIIELFMSANLPECLGMTEAEFMRLALAAFMIIAMVRAYVQRTKKPVAVVAAPPAVDPAAETKVEPFKASESGEILG